MNVEIGSIVKIKNICFKDGIVDHSYKQGRPCIYIGEVDEKMYFMPLSTAEPEKNYVKFRPNERNNLKKFSQINVRNVIEKDLHFVNPTGYLDEEDLVLIFNSVKKYYTTLRSDIDEKVLLLADNYLNGKYEDSNKEDLKKENKSNRHL